MPEKIMRAKLKVSEVTLGENCDIVKMRAVCKDGAYPADGYDEDNTFAKFSPTAELSIQICNPALLGKFRPGQKVYVDFTPADVSTPPQDESGTAGA